ncbi:helix-turn-helix domain-containing protein [Marinobacterium lutimaris]|uniref:helix-turn-helix domain-containing protein n=1 Tax=Marinobacterium lutimaris TaxID=568106 RepID=UPI002E0F2672
MSDKHLSYADRWMLNYEREHQNVSRPTHQQYGQQFPDRQTIRAGLSPAMQSNNPGSACLWNDIPGLATELDPVVESAIQTRKALKLTQESFSRCLGISAKTLRDWEQGRRHPSGAAVTLLAWASLQPEFVRELHRASKARQRPDRQ